MADSKQKPTLRQIAQRANVSAATVSMALRNHPEISQTTRLTIKKLAKEMGYAQDPEIVRLMSYLRSSRSHRKMESLAFISPLTPEELARHPTLLGHFNGAKKRTQDLGFRLEHHALDQGVSEGRLNKILISRGIKGIIIGPNLDQTTPQRPLALSWEHFAYVTLGYSCLAPRTFRITGNHNASMNLALSTLQSKGYRRLGLVIEQWQDDRENNQRSSAFISFQFRKLGATDTIPPMFNPANRKKLLAWFTQYRPDVILGLSIGEAADYLMTQGFTCPGDFSCAELDKQFVGPGSNNSGIDQHPAELGKAAIDTLVALLARNEIGPPDIPQTISIEGAWVDGETTTNTIGRPKKARNRKSK